MTHVADDATLGKFLRRIKGLVERAMKGSLDLEKLWDIIQGHLDGKLANIEGVLRGSHRIVEVKNLTAIFKLDTTNASMPQLWKDANWEVEKHRGLGFVEVRFADGEMYVNDRKVGEYTSERQKVDGTSSPNLRKKLVGKPVLPDAILDLLIREQDNPAVKVFLEKYKDRYPLFWGTIYRISGGALYVRYFSRDGERFDSSVRYLDYDLDADYPALVLEMAVERAA